MILLAVLALQYCAGSSLVQSRRAVSGWGVWASPCGGFSRCGAWALGLGGFRRRGTGVQQLQLLGSRARAQYLWSTGLAALQHVGSTWIRDRTQVSCKQILYHWAVKDVTTFFFFFKKLSTIPLGKGLPWWFIGKETTCQCRRRERHEFDRWVGKISWNRAWQPSPVLLLRESHRPRSLAGCSP